LPPTPKRATAPTFACATSSAAKSFRHAGQSAVDVAHGVVGTRGKSGSLRRRRVHTRAWWSCPGVIYFVGAGTPTVAIKIGMAAQTARLTLREAVVCRMSAIQSSNHELVDLLGIIHFTNGDHPTRDAEARERELHLEFEHLARFRAGQHGAEWFTASEPMLERVAQLSSPPDVFGLPRNFSARVPELTSVE
jgi:hypothetical protein